MKRLAIFFTLCLASAVSTFAQDRSPSVPARPFEVRTRQQLADLQKELDSKAGNQQSDVVAAKGNEMRVAVFVDEKRENDNFEVHDGSDDVYYVLDGEATLMLGGSLTDAKEVSPGEWRGKTATGGKSVKISKGDLVVVPRGTVHQRTVTGKGFAMILIKVFKEPQP